MAPARQWPALVRHHADHRRAFYGDVFGNPDGDTNVVYLTPHIPVAWHRHQRQHDRLFLISGALRVRVFETKPREGVEHILVAMPGERSVLYIPENHWHGYEALTDDTVVLQFNGPAKYDGSDEERLPLADVPWNMWDA